MAKEAAQAEVPAAKPVAEPAADSRLTKPGLAAEALASQPLWLQLRDGNASPGEALRAMSSSFGQLFGDVDLANDPTAHAEARGHGAAAFTQGQRIAFAAGRFAPDTPGGAFTLAHELAHVLQLRAGADPTAGSGIEAVLEVHADRAAFDRPSSS